MLLYCLKRRINRESKNPKVARTKNGRIMLLCKCTVYNSKKTKFIIEQEASGLLSSLGVKTLLPLIWLGSLGVRFEVRQLGLGVKLPSCLKLVRIMLEL